MRQVKWNPEMRNELVVQVQSEGNWVDFASIKDTDDAYCASRYCRHGAEAFRFGREIPASDFRVITNRGEQVELTV